MTRCPVCDADDPNTVRLWDGKEYCRTCLRNYSEEFEEYVQTHPELVSRLDNPETLLDPFKAWRQPAWTGLIVGSLFGFLSVFAFLDNSEKVVSFEASVLLGLLVFAVVYLFSFFHGLFLVWGTWKHSSTPISPTWGVKLGHPIIVIRNNEVFLSFFAGVWGISGRNNYVVPLRNVKLHIAPASRDPILKRYGAVNDDVLLLDFSNVDFKALGIEKAWFDWPLNAWIRTPYLACCNDKWTQPIWEHFFEIIRGRTVLRPVENN